MNGVIFWPLWGTALAAAAAYGWRKVLPGLAAQIRANRPLPPWEPPLPRRTAQDEHFALWEEQFDTEGSDR